MNIHSVNVSDTFELFLLAGVISPQARLTRFVRAGDQ